MVFTIFFLNYYKSHFKGKVTLYHSIEKIEESKLQKLYLRHLFRMFTLYLTYLHLFQKINFLLTMQSVKFYVNLVTELMLSPNIALILQYIYI